jgi:hypothetical protein
MDVGNGYNRKEKGLQKRRDFRGFSGSGSCVSSGSLYLSSGIAFMMADAVIPHPPYANPWNACQESSPSQLSSSSCPTPNSRPLCRFDRPLSPSTNSSLPSYLLTTSSSYQRMHEYTGFEYRQLPHFLSSSEQASSYRSTQTCTYASHILKKTISFRSIERRAL